MYPVMTKVSDWTLGYGFANFERGPNRTAALSDRRSLPQVPLQWKLEVVLGTYDNIAEKANECTARFVNQTIWRRPYPQVMPIAYYAAACLKGDEETVEDEARNTRFFWRSQLGDEEVVAPESADSTAQLTATNNLARFAWGYRWWGQRLSQGRWNKTADSCMNLVLTAPIEKGMFGRAFSYDARYWWTSPFDQAGLATTARYVLRYAADFPNYANAAKAVKFANKAAAVLLEMPLTAESALFLQDYASSADVSDVTIRRQSREYVAQHISSLAINYRNTSNSVATILAWSRSADGTLEKRAKRGLDRVLLSQALWQPPTVVGLDIFGSIVGDRLLDAELGSYAADLIECSVNCSDEISAMRAVKALRAPLNLLNLSGFGRKTTYFPESVYYGQFLGWFDCAFEQPFGAPVSLSAGIGQTLAGYAQVLDRFDSVYRHESGWTLLIDGLYADKSGAIWDAFSFNPRPFSGNFKFSVKEAGKNTAVQQPQPTSYPTISEIGVELIDEVPFVIARPGNSVRIDRDEPSGSFTFGNGKQVTAELRGSGFGCLATKALLASGPVTFRGMSRSSEIFFGPTYLCIGLPDVRKPWPMGWRLLGELADVSTAPESRKGLSTGPANTSVGAVESAHFMVIEEGIAFDLTGGASPSLIVSVMDAATNLPLVSAYKTEPKDIHIEWNLSQYRGKTVYIRIEDRARDAWVGVTNLREGKVKALP